MNKPDVTGLPTAVARGPDGQFAPASPGAPSTADSKAGAIIGALIPVFAVISAAGIAASIYLIFYRAPLQYGMTDAGRLNGSSLFFNQKIFYLHTAHAFWLFGAVGVSGIGSLLYLITRN